MLNAVGLIDMDGVEVPIDRQDLLRSFSSTAGQRTDAELSYGIRPGTSFLNEYEARTYRRAYPVLFPYGEGCPESMSGMGLKEYFKWAMRYPDGRFRHNPHFYFDLFGIQQKREVSAKTAMCFKRRDWTSISQGMAKVTDRDITNAIEEEEARRPVSNPALARFLRTASITRSSVVGSDGSRSGMRPHMWGTSVLFSHPWLFLTINMVDHHDPIVSFLLGKDVNLDNFMNHLGPSAADRAESIVKDPFTGAEYFHIVISAILEHLLGIHKSGGRIHSIPGVLGLIQSYYGVVESQGRGNLHGHFLIWLADTPDCDSIKDLLKTEDFQETIRQYIIRTVHAHAPDVSLEACESQRAPHPNPAYRRPPNPASPNFAAEAETSIRTHLENSQFHTCSRAACLVADRYGKLKCKRHAPFELSNEHTVSADGSYRVERHIPWLNGCNKWIHALALGANGDLKVNLNGSATKGAIFYNTAYPTKAQCICHNCSALLAKTKEYETDSDRQININLRMKKLLTRLLNGMNKRQEISGAMAIASMEGWAPSFTIHEFVNIYIADIFRILQTRVFLGLHPTAIIEDPLDGQDNVEPQDQVTIQVFNGTLVEQSQLTDYAYRGAEFEDMSLVFFCTGTRHIVLSSKERSTYASQKAPPERRGRGRPATTRGMYKVGHPGEKTHIRCMRAERHSQVPSFVGRPFPSASDEDPEKKNLYHATMLMLFCPWTSWEDVVQWGSNWELSFNTFMASATPEVARYVANTQLERQSKAALDESGDSKGRGTGFGPDDQLDEAMAVDIPLEAGPDLPLPLPLPYMESPSVLAYKESVLQAGAQAGLIPGSTSTPSPPIDPALNAAHSLIDKLAGWLTTLESVDDVQVIDSDVPHQEENHMPLARVIPDIEMQDIDQVPVPFDPTVQAYLDTGAGSLAVDPRIGLNDAQQLAFDIVNQHVELTLQGAHPKQLLMKVMGEPGTGKSRVIAAISTMFLARKQQNALVKGAHAGVAASLIGGRTLVSMCKMKIKVKGDGKKDSKNAPVMSAGAIEIAVATWKGKHWFIMDEISQVCVFFWVECGHTDLPCYFGCRLVLKCGQGSQNSAQLPSRVMVLINHLAA